MCYKKGLFQVCFLPQWVSLSKALTASLVLHWPLTCASPLWRVVSLWADIIVFPPSNEKQNVWVTWSNGAATRCEFSRETSSVTVNGFVKISSCCVYPYPYVNLSRDTTFKSKYIPVRFIHAVERIAPLILVLQALRLHRGHIWITNYLLNSCKYTPVAVHLDCEALTENFCGGAKNIGTSTRAHLLPHFLLCAAATLLYNFLIATIKESATTWEYFLKHMHCSCSALCFRFIVFFRCRFDIRACRSGLRQIVCIKGYFLAFCCCFTSRQ